MCSIARHQHGPLVWRDEPPRVGEWDAPDIMGWAFRGSFCPPEERDAYLAAQEELPLQQRRPVETTKRGIVLTLVVTDSDGLPLWAQFGMYLWQFAKLRGQWCPVRIAESHP